MCLISTQKHYNIIKGHLIKDLVYLFNFTFYLKLVTVIYNNLKKLINDIRGVVDTLIAILQ